MADILDNSSKVDHTGLEVTNSANLNSAANSDTFTNDGNTVLVVKNGSGSSVTVTISAQTNEWDDSTVDETASVANGETAVIGPFAPARFNNSDGEVDVSYSATSSVEAAAFELADALRGT